MPYVYLDATYIKSRNDHRIVSGAVVVATAVSADGNREVPGLDVGDSEDEVLWTAFLRTLRDRGLDGVTLVISDAHAGLKASIARVFAGASWQRCKVHLARNILATVGHAHKDMVAATVRTIYAQPDAEAPPPGAAARSGRHARGRFPKAAEVLAGADGDVTAYAAFPRAHWRKISSTNPLDRINEIKRRSNVVGIFPGDASVIRLVILLEQHDEWAVAERRYLSEESMALHRPTPRGDTRTERPHPAGRVVSATGAKGHRPTSTTPRDAIRDITEDFGITESCLGNWIAQARDRGQLPEARNELAELREAKKRIRLLEQENEVLRRAAAYLGQANLPKGALRDSSGSRFGSKVRRDGYKADPSRCRCRPWEALPTSTA